MDFDVIVVGAGPAGLSAALILGRCRRRVLVLDANRPRNAASRALHGFLTREGIPPLELRRVAREQLQPYSTVSLVNQEATAASCIDSGFELTLADGTRVTSRKLLLATGVVDELPAVEGLPQLYGRNVFHCPYCDGWECRDQPIGVYARRSNGVGLALQLKVWSRDIALFTDGVRLSEAHASRLAKHGIPWYRTRIARLEGTDGQLEHVVLADGQRVERRALFFSTPQRQASDLAARLGCRFTSKGAVRTGDYEATEIPGLYVAGDASRLVQLAIVAASEGAQAAFAINKALMAEDGFR